jgi:hypothetical protein
VESGVDVVKKAVADVVGVASGLCDGLPDVELLGNGCVSVVVTREWVESWRDGLATRTTRKPMAQSLTSKSGPTGAESLSGVSTKAANIRANHGHLEERGKIEHLLDLPPVLLPCAQVVTRKSNEEVLFDSSAASLIFQDQYLRLRTSLPENPNLYGLGEHTDNFRLNTTDYVRTFWNRDSYGIPAGTNLYGSHPVYFEHRGEEGTHGVFLLSSSGMDVKIDVEDGQQYLEYNVLGGVLDLYFMAGETPTEVSQQYAEVAGLPVMMPYWGFGLHQCRLYI